MTASSSHSPAASLCVFHAGSLGRAMGLIGDAFRAGTDQDVRLVASGSGSLRQRIEQGERPDLFASADLGHPRALTAQGLAQAPAIFARNTQCLLVRRGLGLSPPQVVDRLLDPGIRVGVSTPGLDPGGDYAWDLFGRIGALRPGAAERLKAKALRLVGDPALPLPPREYPRHQVLWHLEEGRADVFLVYLTTALQAIQEAEWAELVELPVELRVRAVCGLCVLQGAQPAAVQLRAFILGPEGQAILRNCGFGPP